MRFVAAIDTPFYGVYYSQGALVDVTGWTRKQLLQFLDKGLISPADVNGEAIGDISLAELADVADIPGNLGQVLTRVGSGWAPADIVVTGDNAYADQILDAHVHSSTPHPAYDDIPSLTLLFENGLV